MLSLHLMLVLILFAFLGGIVTILSPCILPILPIVLSGSLTGGKSRPWGIVFGFIASFTFFTLFLTAMVRLLGLSADFLRLLAVVVIFLFGLGLLIPQFQVLLEKLFNKLTPLAQNQSQKQGFGGGILIGLSLGLVWTPCVGPIMAAIIALAATSSVSLTAILITLAYSIGTAIPLLAITYGGRNLLTRGPWLVKNTTTIQKTFGVLMLVTALAIYLNIDRRFQTWVLTKFPNYGVGLTQIEDHPLVIQALEKLNASPMPDGKRGKPMFEMLEETGTPAPELIPGGEWINSQSLTIKSLRGKVVLVDFWTYTCINCIRTLPYIQSWHEKYKDKGLVIIGVHTPEFEFEKDLANVKKAVKDFGLTYPIMQDNNYATWNAYHNRYWPAKYLVDKNSNIRYTHFGEGNYDETEEMIQKLLAEAGTPVNEAISNLDYQIEARTPELYLGTDRYQYGFTSFEGDWQHFPEYSKPAKNAILTLNFNAKNVYLVMKLTQPAISGTIVVTLDNGAAENIQTIQVDADKIYQLIKLSQPGQHNLKIEFKDSNIEVYAFTFG